MYIIKNVFTDGQRHKLLKDVQPLLVDGTTLAAYYKSFHRYPGKQTHDTLHLHPDFISPIQAMVRIIFQEIGLNFVVSKSWINWTNGKKKDIVWHRHYCDYALVYYIKTPLPFFSNGTLFEDGFVRAPQNSMIIFPAHLVHTAPTSPFRFDRYTLAGELNNG